MTDFKDRERGEETKYAFDQETEFKIAARRNRLRALFPRIVLPELCAASPGMQLRNPVRMQVRISEASAGQSMGAAIALGSPGVPPEGAGSPPW